MALSLPDPLNPLDPPISPTDPLTGPVTNPGFPTDPVTGPATAPGSLPGSHLGFRSVPGAGSPARAAGLRLSDVSCRHGRLLAVDRVDLTLAPGADRSDQFQLFAAGQGTARRSRDLRSGDAGRAEDGCCVRLAAERRSSVASPRQAQQRNLRRHLSVQ